MFWLLFGVGLIAIIYLYFIKPVQYWKNHQVPQQSVLKIWKDVILTFIIPCKGVTELMQNAYNDFPGKRYAGMYQFTTPAILLLDPALIQQITIKDFDYFTNHPSFLPDEVDDIFNNTLFSLKDETWRKMRSTLSPSFTSSKLKTIFPLITECSAQFVNYFEQNIKEVKAVEMKEIFSKVSMDIIATSAYGITCNSLENPKNDFYLTGKALTNFQDVMTNLRLLLLLFLPKVAKRCSHTATNVKFFNPKYVSFFQDIINQNIKSREERGIVRPDMIQLLLEARRKSEANPVMEQDDDEGFAVLNENASAGKPSTSFNISNEDIVAQAFIFFLAGFDIVTNAMSFLAYELAVNPEIQEKLYEDILKHQNDYGDHPTYERLLKMKYLDMVISESLRKYPISVVTDRICNKRYTIQPTADEEKPITLEAGSIIWIPIIGLHRDPQLYPNPDRFDPERFSDENKSNIAPETYIPFGSGPRFCMGNRFALMEMKIVMFYLISKFKLVVVDKTQIPLKIANSQISMVAKDGYWVGLEKRIKS